MKILFDSQIFDSQKYGGISRYFCELFKRFNKIKNFEYTLPIKDTQNKYLLEIQTSNKEIGLHKNLLSGINYKLQILINSFYDFFDINSNFNKAKTALRKQDFNIFHPTYYSPYFLKYLETKPFVLTVYDMIHEIYPEYSPKISKQKNKLIKRATKIIAISENTKKDIMRFYDIPKDKIKVIHLGNSLEKTEKIPLFTKDIPQKYILFVGARNNYKNFIFFIESITPLLNNNTDINIIAVGGYSGKSNFTNEEKKLFTKLNINKQIVHFSVTDEELAYLYQNAICFVFPSLYEGFGIPILEAFACDCPAVISNTSSLPEVGGDAAMYFNPKDSGSILDAVKKVISDEALRLQMITQGREQLKKFSWDKTAEETVSLYKSII